MIMALKLPDQLSVNRYHGLLICLNKTLPRIYHVSCTILVGDGHENFNISIENFSKTDCKYLHKPKKDF